MEESEKPFQILEYGQKHNQTIMKKKFFLHKTVDALSEKQIKDLDQVFGGVVGIPIDDIIHYPTGGGGPRCPDGYYWNVNRGRCMKLWDVAVPADRLPMEA